MTTSPQVNTAAVLRDVVMAIAGASGRVDQQTSRDRSHSVFYEVRADGFHVCVVEIAVDGRLLTARPKE